MKKFGRNNNLIQYEAEENEDVGESDNYSEEELSEPSGGSSVEEQTDEGCESEHKTEDEGTKTQKFAKKKKEKGKNLLSSSEKSAVSSPKRKSCSSSSLSNTKKLKKTQQKSLGTANYYKQVIRGKSLNIVQPNCYSYDIFVLKDCESLRFRLVRRNLPDHHLFAALKADVLHRNEEGQVFLQMK